MKISLRRALELAVGPANVDAAGHAVADWFDSIDRNATANRVREALRDQPGQPADAVPHNRPDTSLRSELLAELASQQEVVSSLRERVERLERRWANETAGGDKLDRLIAQDKDADGPAVSEDREPASVVGEPSDEELLGLYPLSMTDLDDAFAFARAVLARWGHQPAPPAEGEVIWQSIDTAPKDGTEILASDYDAIEIVSWEGFSGAEGWETRLGEAMFPTWWQPLPDHPPLPGDEPELPNGSELPDGYIDPGHSAADREMLEAFYLAARSEGGTTDEITLRGICAATRAAELVEQRHAEPVLRSERLPGPGDCHFNPGAEIGSCWCFNPVEYLGGIAWWSFEPLEWNETATHWLPAIALPLPAGEGEE